MKKLLLTMTTILSVVSCKHAASSSALESGVSVGQTPVPSEIGGVLYGLGSISLTVQGKPIYSCPTRAPVKGLVYQWESANSNETLTFNGTYVDKIEIQEGGSSRYESGESVSFSHCMENGQPWLLISPNFPRSAGSDFDLLKFARLQKTATGSYEVLGEYNSKDGLFCTRQDDRGRMNENCLVLASKGFYILGAIANDDTTFPNVGDDDPS